MIYLFLFCKIPIRKAMLVGASAQPAIQRETKDIMKLQVTAGIKIDQVAEWNAVVLRPL